MKRSFWLIFSDIARRSHRTKIDFKLYIYNGIKHNTYSSIYSRWLVSNKISKFSFKYNATTQRNVCRITGRARAVSFKSGLSRLQHKYYAGCGMLSGYVRGGR